MYPFNNRAKCTFICKCTFHTIPFLFEPWGIINFIVHTETSFLLDNKCVRDYINTQKHCQSLYSENHPLLLLLLVFTPPHTDSFYPMTHPLPKDLGEKDIKYQLLGNKGLVQLQKLSLIYIFTQIMSLLCFCFKLCYALYLDVPLYEPFGLMGSLGGGD